VPALPNAPNCLQLRFLHTVGTDTNTGWHLFFRADKPATQADMDGLTAAANTSWGTQLGPLHAADVTLTSVHGIDLYSASGVVSVSSTPHVGTRTGGFLPASSCALYNMGIGRRYRGGKPRQYVPAGTQPDLSNAQTWAAAFINALNTAMNSLIGACAVQILSWSTIADLVNISYYHQVPNTVVPPTPAFQTVVRPVPQIDNIVTHATSSTVGSQRRRLRPG